MTTVESEADGVIAKSVSTCNLFRRPDVDVFSVSVTRASSAVIAMYGSSLLILLRCFMLLVLSEVAGMFVLYTGYFDKIWLIGGL